MPQLIDGDGARQAPGKPFVEASRPLDRSNQSPDNMQERRGSTILVPAASGSARRSSHELRSRIEPCDPAPPSGQHSQQAQQKAYLLRACRGLMEYGAPTHRLEEYMQRTAQVLGLQIQSFYLPGCMIISFNASLYSASDVHIVRCTQSLNLAKLYEVHEVYKDVIHRRITATAAAARLEEIAATQSAFNLPTRVLAYGIGSMCIGPVSYGARPINLPIIFFLGTLLGCAELVAAPRVELFNQIFEISTTILIAFLARAFGSIRLPHDQAFCFSALCQASIVMILPGFIVTNSALELQCKHIIAGSVRLVYGLVFILFLAFGITIGTTIYGAIDAAATSLTSCSPVWPVWWQIIFVPLFTLSWIIVNQAPWRKMPAMIIVTLAGWCVNHFSGLYFTASTIISQTLGALTIGLLANVYSRLGHEFAAAILHPAIFIQVPGSLAASGGLVSGIASADIVNGRTPSTNTQGQYELLKASYSMVEIAIGITVGLSVSALLVYPFRRRKGKSGIFSF